MRHQSFLSPLMTLAFLSVSGCFWHSGKTARVAADRDSWKARYDAEAVNRAAATTRATDAEQKLADTQMELKKANEDLAASQAAGRSQLEKSQDELAAALAKESDAQRQMAFSERAAEARKADDQKRVDSLNARISELQKKIDALTTENELLKAASPRPPASQPAP